jgi:hypothetical protein
MRSRYVLGWWLGEEDKKVGGGGISKERLGNGEGKEMEYELREEGYSPFRKKRAKRVGKLDWVWW